MILYKNYHVPLILDLTKDITRRGGKKRWNIGAFHQFKTGFKSNDVFAGARIEDVYEQALGDISSQHVLREGYQTREEYFEAYRSINRLVVMNLDMLVWVVEFTVMGLMEVSSDNQIDALLEYDDPRIPVLKVHPIFRFRAVNVNPSEKFSKLSA